VLFRVFKVAIRKLLLLFNGSVILVRKKELEVEDNDMATRHWLPPDFKILIVYLSLAPHQHFFVLTLFFCLTLDAGWAFWPRSAFYTPLACYSHSPLNLILSDFQLICKSTYLAYLLI
jgi:hypothetical protein